jgi:large subunit ribosomal protein L6
MHKNRSKSYTLKIPQNLKVLYSKKKKIITVIGPLAKKSLRISLKIKLCHIKKIMEITTTSEYAISNDKKKKIKTLQGTTAALIKQVFFETSAVMYQKLKFIGVGYRTYRVPSSGDKLLLFRLGYSHPVYFKIPKNIKIFCLKLTKLFISGNSYKNVTETAAIIKSCKPPEPYKGKGILHHDERIEIKEGKKI